MLQQTGHVRGCTPLALERGEREEHPPSATMQCRHCTILCTSVARIGTR